MGSSAGSRFLIAEPSWRSYRFVPVCQVVWAPPLGSFGPERCMSEHPARQLMRNAQSQLVPRYPFECGPSFSRVFSYRALRFFGRVGSPES